MSQYHMSVNQRKAHAQAMNRALAESYERLMDLCNERFDEDHSDPKLADLTDHPHAFTVISYQKNNHITDASIFNDHQQSPDLISL